MASSFIYRPHVENLENVITPDILVYSLVVAEKGNPETSPIPIDRVTTDTEIQVVGSGNVPDASLALIGSGAGMLITIASNHGNPNEPVSRLSCAKPLCRHAWRYNDVADHVSRLVMRTVVISGSGEDILQQGSVGKSLNSNLDEVPTGSAILLTGLPLIGPISGSVFQIELADPILNRILQFRYRVYEL